jgi:hypothetical protein
VPTPHAVEIVLTADERAELEGWARRRTSAAGLATRARIVLAAADGGSNTDLADRLEMSIGTWNDNPRPYIWTKTADQILASIGNYCHRINDSGH